MSSRDRLGAPGAYSLRVSTFFRRRRCLNLPTPIAYSLHLRIFSRRRGLKLLSQPPYSLCITMFLIPDATPASYSLKSCLGSTPQGSFFKICMLAQSFLQVCSVSRLSHGSKESPAVLLGSRGESEPEHLIQYELRLSMPYSEARPC